MGINDKNPVFLTDTVPVPTFILPKIPLAWFAIWSLIGGSQ